MNIHSYKKIHRQWWSTIVLAAITLLSSVILTSCATPAAGTYANEITPETRVNQANTAFNKNPDSVNRQQVHTSKELAVFELLTLAEQAMLRKDHASAKQYYERVLAFSPKNQSAIAGINEVNRELKSNKKLENASQALNENRADDAKEIVHDVLVTHPNNQQAKVLSESIEEKVGEAKQAPLRIKTNHQKPISLELREVSPKIAFEALSRTTSINFVLDKDIKSDSKVNISIKNMLIEDAIDMIVASNGFQKKVLSENTLFIFANTPQKRKDFQDLKVRSFYLNNVSAKEVANMLKTILKSKDIYVEERLNVLVLRDTPDAVRLAEKLVSVVDVADSEVMLDIEVLEVSRNRLQELGIVYPNQLAVISADTGLTLEALKNLSSKTIGVSPNPAINFKKTTGDVNLLSNPRIRVKNNEKAKILVGDKVPIITTTSTANVGVSENVTYVDVGLKLDVEPKINLENFVTIKVGLEVSSLGDKTVTKNGATVYTIGTRNANTLLRLKDGETQILAGLILDDERKNSARLPGLGDVPILGRLFSNQEDKKSKTEIVLAITPRVLANLQLPKSDVFDFWSGTDSEISDSLRRFNVPASANGGAIGNGQTLPGAESPALTPLERLMQQRTEREQEIETKKIEDQYRQEQNDPFKQLQIQQPAGQEGAKPATTVTMPTN